MGLRCGESQIAAQAMRDRIELGIVPAAILTNVRPVEKLEVRPHDQPPGAAFGTNELTIRRVEVLRGSHVRAGEVMNQPIAFDPRRATLPASLPKRRQRVTAGTNINAIADHRAQHACFGPTLQNVAGQWLAVESC